VTAFLRGLPASLLMVIAAFLFASMGVAVKLASAHYHTGEIVLYRGLIGAAMVAAITRVQGGTLKTAVPAMHFWRSASGVASLMLWFYALSNLPLATAMTLNYMSSVWMALFLIGGAVALGGARVDGRLVATVLVGFAGVALILRPTMDDRQLWHGLAGLLSGMLAATAYLQVTTLGRAGEPEARIVFYFAVGSVATGLVSALWTGFSAHSATGVGLLVAVGLLATGGQLLMTRAYRTGRTLTNATLQYLGIGFAFAWGALLFDEAITWMAALGVALIVVAGLAATMLRTKAAPDSTFTSES
jgi:drug/metabolite transporter (DMT)-like permease